MSTGYPGRETQFDLGGGHSFAWPADLDPQAIPYGIIEAHFYGDRGGWHSFLLTFTGSGAGQLLAGSPGIEPALTVQGPVTCPACGIRGQIIAGRWLGQD